MTTYQSPRYISVTDCAKFIRTDLKTSFPGIKFSVKSKSYSGGASVSVSWTDGPTSKAVEAIAGKYDGASFDGMEDLKSYHQSELDGETVHFSNDWTSCNRKYSVQFMTDVARRYCERYRLAMPKIEVSCNDAYIERDYTRGREDYRQRILDKIWNLDASEIDHMFDEEDRDLAEYDARVAARKAAEEAAPVEEEKTLITILEDRPCNEKYVRILRVGSHQSFCAVIGGEMAFHLKRYNSVLVDNETINAAITKRLEAAS